MFHFPSLFLRKISKRIPFSYISLPWISFRSSSNAACSTFARSISSCLKRKICTQTENSILTSVAENERLPQKKKTKENYSAKLRSFFRKKKKKFQNKNKERERSEKKRNEAKKKGEKKLLLKYSSSSVFIRNDWLPQIFHRRGLKIERKKAINYKSN